MKQKLQILKPKDANEIWPDVKEVKDILLISGQSRIVGSAQYENLEYNNDIDIMEYIKSVKGCPKNPLLCIRHRFLEIFKLIGEVPYCYVLDLKCGIDKDGEPLRWSYNSLQRGFIKRPDAKYVFTDCLKQKATFKIDIARNIDGIFTMITEKYFINIGNGLIQNYFQQDTHKSIILHDLEKDYYDYMYVKCNYLKHSKERLVGLF